MEVMSGGVEHEMASETNAQAVALLQAWVADMSFWMVLVATLVIGGVFMWSMLTAARDADRWNERLRK